MSFPRYPKYKDSGVEWLGEVPEHWKIRRIGTVCTLVNGYPFDSGLFNPDEGTPLVRIRDLNSTEVETRYSGNFIERAAITSADVLIGMDGDFNVGRWRGAGVALLNQRMCCVRGHSPIITRLLEYSLPIPLNAINEVTYSTTVKHLSTSQINKASVAISPDDRELVSILDFLDSETAKIDALIQEQQRLIELLKEKRQAVISHAVTKGLNPNVRMKPSGIEWLGEVPEHWEKLSLKRDLEFVTSGARGWAENYSENGKLFIRIGNLTRGTVQLNLSDVQRVEVPIGAERSRTMVRAGDLLFSVTAYLGSVAIVPDELEEAYVSQHVALARLSDRRLLSKWVAFTALSDLGQTWFDLQAYGGTKIQLSLDDVRDLPVFAPPKEEQREVIDYIEIQSAKIDRLIVESQETITLLQERRTALISAAVTGKIDVRGIAELRKAA